MIEQSNDSIAHIIPCSIFITVYLFIETELGSTDLTCISTHIPENPIAAPIRAKRICGERDVISDSLCAALLTSIGMALSASAMGFFSIKSVIEISAEKNDI